MLIHKDHEPLGHIERAAATGDQSRVEPMVINSALCDCAGSGPRGGCVCLDAFDER